MVTGCYAGTATKMMSPTAMIPTKMKRKVDHTLDSLPMMNNRTKMFPKNLLMRKSKNGKQLP